MRSLAAAYKPGLDETNVFRLCDLGCLLCWLLHPHVDGKIKSKSEIWLATQVSYLTRCNKVGASFGAGFNVRDLHHSNDGYGVDAHAAGARDDRCLSSRWQ